MCMSYCGTYSKRDIIFEKKNNDVILDRAAAAWIGPPIQRAARAAFSLLCFGASAGLTQPVLTRKATFI